MPSQFYLSAAHKSSGKTMLSVGLSTVFSDKNYSVQTFKKGLDYIDPIWLSLASKNPCYNLDFYTSTHQEIKQTFKQHSNNKDICIVEGNKGLYDGITTSGGDSNADMARLLNLPIVLVLDCIGITRGIAPLLQGYQNFENSNIIGVILNKVSGSRHESKLRNAVETYTDLIVFGAMSRDNSLFIDERYLGLKPANEYDKAATHLQALTKRINQSINLTQLQQKTTVKDPSHDSQTQINNSPNNTIPIHLTLAVAKDKAFGFYYADDLETFQNLGVKITYFDTLTDQQLPKADALFIGGGFPEIYAQQLADNQLLLADIKNQIENGLPTYAECGGLMYLTQGIQTNNGFFRMVGVIQAKTQIYPKPIGRGYVQLTPNKNHLWHTTNTIFAHEFHYSALIDIEENLQYAYTVKRGISTKDQQDGIIKHNLLACYTHLRHTQHNNWVEKFINFIKSKNPDSSLKTQTQGL